MPQTVEIVLAVLPTVSGILQTVRFVDDVLDLGTVTVKQLPLEQLQEEESYEKRKLSW